MPRRRDFLRQAGLMAAMTRMGVTPAPPQTARIETAVIPSTGDRVPRVGLGTWQTFDVGKDATKRKALAETLHAFLEHGGRVIDTSPMYGSSEEVLGDLLATEPLRDRAWLATKVWTTGASAGIDQMRMSLRQLRTDRVQLMQIHNLQDWRTHLRTLRQWKTEGRIRLVGITHYQAGALDQVEAILRAEQLDAVQMNLSLDEPEAARLLPLCTERGVAFVANRPFGGGASFRRVRDRALPPWATEAGIGSWAQFMLKWILSHPAVTVAIPGTSRAAHAIDNLRAASGVIPDVALRARMTSYWRSLQGAG